MLDPNNQTTVYSAKETSTALKDFIVKSGRTLDATVYSVSDGNEGLLKKAGRVTLNKGHILEGSRADKIQRTVRYLAVSYTHLTLPRRLRCRSRWSPYH